MGIRLWHRTELPVAEREKVCRRHVVDRGEVPGHDLAAVYRAIPAGRGRWRASSGTMASGGAVVCSSDTQHQQEQEQERRRHFRGVFYPMPGPTAPPQILESAQLGGGTIERKAIFIRLTPPKKVPPNVGPGICELAFVDFERLCLPKGRPSPARSDEG